MTIGFAANARRSAPVADPPRVETPEPARQACPLYTLPTNRVPARADLEIGYASRGVNVLECDGRRQLAVSAGDREHEAEDRWKAARDERRRPFWMKLTPWREGPPAQ